jgi:hypothetical protein
MKKLVLTSVLLFASMQAFADEWTPEFRITALYVAGATNFHYRVFGMPNMPVCANGVNWAYVNEADPGSKGFIAAMLSAHASGKPIQVLTTPVNGFCHILELIIR